MDFGQLVSNENQQTKFKTFSTFKMLRKFNAMKVLHDRSNIAAFLVKHLKFPERNIFSVGM